MNRLYYKYSDYLIGKYNCKVYKIPINLPGTCPNRDGKVSTGGCTFCSEKAADYEMLDNSMSVRDQINKNIEYIGKKYRANSFIAYFQNFTSTYLDFKDFCQYIEEALVENIVEIAISTRPDCITSRHLDYLNEIKKTHGVNISFELGLQTCNYKTLAKINRGHTLAEFIYGVLLIKKYGFHICTHVIINLPWDDIDDSIECAKILSVLKIDSVKIHSLAIIKNTYMETQYLNKEFIMISKDEYISRLISFLEYLDSAIAIQRLFSRIPEEITLFSNWGTSWRKLNNELDEKMLYNNSYQGKYSIT